MRMKLSISKKIMLMVILPIVFICLIVGVACVIITDNNITDEIQTQLHVSAYDFKERCSVLDNDDMQKSMNDFYKENSIDVTIFSNGIRTLSTVDGAVGTKMDEGILATIKTGENYFATDANVNGEPYFGYYIPILEGDKYVGATFTGIPQAKVNSTILRSVATIIGCILAAGVIVTIISLLIIKKIVKGINNLQNMMNILLSNDLSVKHETYEVVHDEIEEICNKISDFSSQLNAIICGVKVASNGLKQVASDLKNATEVTNETSNEISKAIEEVAQGAVSQAEETTDATNKMESMSEELNSIKTNVNDLHSITGSMNTAKINVVNTLSELQNVNNAISSDIDATNEQVGITNASVQKIKDAIGMIKDITDQTKLLALNASIEAARAGEHGRGFAVVAENITTLANQSADSSNEIEGILDDLSKNYAQIIETVSNTTGNMSEQNRKLTETQSMFIILEQDIDNTVERISSINAMIENLDRGIQNMVDVIANLSAISEENSAGAEQTMASLEELNATISQVYEKAQNVDSSADSLLNEINIFKTA